MHVQHFIKVSTNFPKKHHSASTFSSISFYSKWYETPPTFNCFYLEWKKNSVADVVKRKLIVFRELFILSLNELSDIGRSKRTNQQKKEHEKKLFENSFSPAQMLFHLIASHTQANTGTWFICCPSILITCDTMFFFNFEYSINSQHLCRMHFEML